MFRKKKKYRLSGIVANLVNYEEDKNYSIAIQLDEGDTHKEQSIGGDLLIYNSEGFIKDRFHWQAGYTVRLSFNYVPVEWYDGVDGD